MSAKRGRGLVTGTGAVSPLGRSASEFYTRLCAGENAIRELPPQDRRDMQATHAARYDGFSPQPEIPAMKARRLDRGSQFALIACGQAVAEAGYAIGEDPEAIGIAMGTGSAGAGALTEFLRVLILESPEAAPPFHFPNTVANAPASQVSIELKIYGPNVTITQKDPSALNALLFSTLALGSGRARAMLAGAVDEWNPFYAMGFDRVGALRGDETGERHRPGRGRLRDSARGRRDSEAARRRAARAPLGNRLGRRRLRAVPIRSRSPRHGTRDAGSARRRRDGPRRDRPLAVLARRGREMDAAEAEAAAAVFGAPPPRELSVKDAIGEMAAAGGAQLVAASRAIAAGQAQRVLVNSFGAGGNFLAAVMESPR